MGGFTTLAIRFALTLLFNPPALLHEMALPLSFSLDFYRMLLRLSMGIVRIRVHLSELCAKEKNLRGVVDPQ